MSDIKIILNRLCSDCGETHPTTDFVKVLRNQQHHEVCSRCAKQVEADDYVEVRNNFAGEAGEGQEAVFDAKLTAQQLLARREMSRRRFLPFVFEFRPGYQAGWVHKDICRRLEKFSKDVAAKLSPRLMLFMPPRSGKSELVSRCFPAWHLGHYPTDEIIACSYAASLANSFSRKVREILRDPSYRTIFPSTALDKSSQAVEQWMTSKGGGYVAAGVGGPIVGKGANVLIIDDPTKGRTEAQSDVVKEAVKDWYTGSAYTRLAPGGGILVVMQRWAEDDLAGWLESEDKQTQNENWDIIRYPAIAIEDEEFRFKGAALHPERYDLKALQRIRVTIGERDFAALYQQNPIPDEGDYFKKPHFRYYVPQDLPNINELRLFCTFDLAIGEKEQNDYTAGVVAGVDNAANIYVLRVYHEKIDALKIAELLFDIWDDWKPEVIGLEKGHIEGTMAPFLAKMAEERRVFPFFDPLPVGRKDKVARAQAIRGWMAHGKVYWNRMDPMQNEAIEELLKFPNGKHDDRVDMMAHLGQMLQDMFGAGEDKEPVKTAAKWREEFERKLSMAGTEGSTHMSA